MFRTNNRFPALKQVLDTLKLHHDNIINKDGPADALQSMLEFFYGLNHEEAVTIVKKLCALRIEDIDDTRYNLNNKYKDMVRQDETLKFILDTEIVKKNIEKLYQPLLGSPLEAEAKSESTRIIKYFHNDVPKNLRSIAMWEGNIERWRSGLCHAYDLIPELIAQAQESCVPSKSICSIS